MVSKQLVKEYSTEFVGPWTSWDVAGVYLSRILWVGTDVKG